MITTDKPKSAGPENSAGLPDGPPEVRNELEAFSYAASHELRAPLQIIRGFSEAVIADRTSVLSEESRGYLERIRRSAARIDSTISGLLAYARLEREKVTLRNISLESLVADVLAQYELLITETGATVAIKPGLPPVYGEPEALFQALSNLFSNALKFTSAGHAPHIRVWAAPAGDKIRIWVEDQGIGIAAQHQKRIFQLFERLNSQQAYPGTGVGLSLVRRAVEKIGGRVGVESELGRGSGFWIELPPAST